MANNRRLVLYLFEMATGFEEAKKFDAEVQARGVEIIKKQKMAAMSRHK